MTQKQRSAKSDRQVSAAKKEYRENFRDDHGYIFCEGCGINESVDRIDISHTVGIGQDKSLAADPGNLALMCRTKCHPRVEARDLKGLNNERRLTEYIENNDNKSLEKKKLKAEIKKLSKDNLAA